MNKGSTSLFAALKESAADERNSNEFVGMLARRYFAEPGADPDTRKECAKLVAEKVKPLLESGSLPPMWPFWLPLVDAIAEQLAEDRTG